MLSPQNQHKGTFTKGRDLQRVEVRLQYRGKQRDFAIKSNSPWAIIDLKEFYQNGFKGNRASNFQNEINTNYVTLLLALMKGLEAVTCWGNSDTLQSQTCVMLHKRILKNCQKWVSRVSYHLQLLFYGRHRWPEGNTHVLGDFKGRQRTFTVQVRGQALSYCV